MTLIDTPGFNDPDRMRSDKHIFMDLINTIRHPLKSPDEGISMFVQCMMPDESDRIRQSAINAMLNLLLILSIFNNKTLLSDISENHPLIAVVFNHVSKYEDIEKTKQKIQKYKSLLLEKACEFYCLSISDDTEIAKFKWKDLKQ